MIGGAVLFVFCIFMISISQPEHYYQVLQLTFFTMIVNNPLSLSQLLLSQGFGMGMAVGIMYIPALGVISHYFQKRRALAIGIATSVGQMLAKNSQ